MRVVLFALTGFGNEALQSLRRCNCEVVGLFTRRESGPYPYYFMKNIAQQARKMGVNVYEDLNWKEIKSLMFSMRPELLLVSTFHKIIPNEILDIPKTCINIHPGLLPEYAGRNPIKAALAANEETTGVTAHYLTEEVDGGDIIIREKIGVFADDTEKTLRRLLTHLSGTIIRRVIKKIEYENG